MNHSQKQIFFIAAISAALAVAIGAFGAHALKNLLESTGRVAVFETANKYHFIHTLGLFVIAFLMEKIPAEKLKMAAWLMLVGIFIFSGSLYALCILDMKMLGMITPIGGVFFIVSWLILAWQIKKL